ncbi:MAG: YfbU family protein [Acidobacteriota bacterium]
MATRTERFEMRVDEELLERLDEWRGKQDDVPSRAEAMRRLVDLGLGPTGRAVNFSDGEKLIMVMLQDFAKGLKLKSGEIDFDFVTEVLYGGHYWAPTWKMTGLFHNHVDKPEEVTFVVNTLDMWDSMEMTYAALSADDKKVLAKAVHHEHVRFPGFDGNEEATYLGIATFLIEKMDRFTRFRGRELNSHASTVGRHRRMLGVFLPMRATWHGGQLSAQQLTKILKSADMREN